VLCTRGSAFDRRQCTSGEVAGLTGATHDERSPDRLISAMAIAPGRKRRGPARSNRVSPSYARAATSRASWLPGFLESRRLAEKALSAAAQEAYVHGVLTRSVDDLVKAMGYP
jgi:putative transposase